MDDLLLTQQQAEYLTKCLKAVFKNHYADLTDGDSGKITIKSNNGDTFLLWYHYAIGNNHLQFMDDRTKLTLLRMNLNDSFHKNADGSIISGNRVNIFSAEEYYAKANSTTHTKAIPLPFNGLRNTDDFLTALSDLLTYTNTHARDKISIQIRDPLI